MSSKFFDLPVVGERKRLEKGFRELFLKTSCSCGDEVAGKAGEQHLLTVKVIGGIIHGSQGQESLAGHL